MNVKIESETKKDKLLLTEKVPRFTISKAQL